MLFVCRMFLRIWILSFCLWLYKKLYWKYFDYLISWCWIMQYFNNCSLKIKYFDLKLNLTKCGKHCVRRKLFFDWTQLLILLLILSECYLLLKLEKNSGNSYLQKVRLSAFSIYIYILAKKFPELVMLRPSNVWNILKYYFDFKVCYFILKYVLYAFSTKIYWLRNTPSLW